MTVIIYGGLGTPLDVILAKGGADRFKYNFRVR